MSIFVSVLQPRLPLDEHLLQRERIEVELKDLPRGRARALLARKMRAIESAIRLEDWLSYRPDRN